MFRANILPWLVTAAAYSLIFREASGEDAPPVGPGGQWEIEGRDGTRTVWRGSMSLTREAPGQFSGSIDWSASGGSSDGAAGRELIHASYNRQSRTLSIAGEALEDANGLALGKYSAILSQDGNELREGKWSTDGSPGSWKARRVTAQAAVETTTDDDVGLLANPKTGFVRKKYALPDGDKADYWLFVPHHYRITKETPVIMFLHGAGETKGEGGGLPVEIGLGPYIHQHEKNFPYLTIFPQAQEKWWKPKGINGQMLQGILNRTLKEYKTDANRVYLTGLSMGGIGAWNNALADPEPWAAIVPICGSGDPEKAQRIKDLPCWAFHGAADPKVDVSGSREMIAALKAAGGKPRYTEYPNLKHNCWERAYATPELWKWLSEQRKP